MRRWMPILFVAAGCIAAASPPDRSTFDRYCVGCHNNKLKSGGLALDGLDPARAGEQPEAWEKVVRKLRARYMPPAGIPRPDERTYDELISSLSATLDAAAAANPNPGRTDTFRRLNRTEYHNSIRDLLALDVDVSELLPADESSYGFDNVTVGNLSPTLLERYLAAARQISRLALGAPLRPEGFTITLPPDLTQEQHLEGLPLGTRGGLAIEHEFPRDGEYEFQLRLTRDRNEHVEGLNGTHEVELMLDDERVGLFTVKPPRGSEDHHAVDQGLHVRIPVKAGPHTLAADFPKKLSALPETERQPYQAHFNMDRHPRIQPAVYSLTVNGPFDSSGPGDTPSRRRLLICKPGGAGEEEVCAKRILSTVMRRAYRRPVTDGDLQAPMQFYREACKQDGFESGIEMGLRAVLVSPEFLFRVEQDPAGVAPRSNYRISGLALASRLSFFLWSSI
ncbi:MAG TPA: DUF1587 domain-containing protein, partial [Bryobacteraceae bacterium]